jgi:transposase
MAAVEEGQKPLRESTAAGRPPTLDEERAGILRGYVLCETFENRAVGLADVRHFAKAQFDVDISEATACRYLHELGFSKHAVKLRADAYERDPEKLFDMAKAFLGGLRFDGDQELCACNDFT